MSPGDEPARVECYAGGRGEETPRRLRIGAGWKPVTVLERWISEDVGRGSRLRWFRVRLEGGGEGLVYRDEALDLWFWRPTPRP